MAHAMATLANNGVVMKPHLVKMTEDPFASANADCTKRKLPYS
jgi:penicillin-binding protein 2